MAKAVSTSVASLERVPMLAELSKRERQQLAKSMKTRTFPPGKQVVIQGRRGIGFFVISDGTAAVSIGDNVVRVLGPGDYFGEMALIDGDVRSATITADSALECLTITSWEFKAFVLEHPNVAWSLLRTMADRVREAGAR